MRAGRTLRPDASVSEDEDQKSHGRILHEEIEEGLQQLRRSERGLLLSGLSGGLDIGFGVVVIAIVETLAAGSLPELVLRMLVASASSIGFIFVVLGRSALFTEHTTLAALPVFAGRAGVGSLLRLWALIYVANLAGAAAFSVLVAYVVPALGAAPAAAFHDIAWRLVDHAAAPMFLSAVLAGWLMGLLSWLVTAARDTTAKLLVVWLVTSVIGFAGFHHSIFGAVETITGALLSPTLGALDVLRFLALATAGNAVGGVVFVALVKYGHAAPASA